MRLKIGVLPRRVEKLRKVDLKPEDCPGKTMPFEFVDVSSFVDETENEHISEESLLNSYVINLRNS